VRIKASTSAAPAGALKLRAHNLMIFLQMADGVDDDTLAHHVRRGDYTQWFRDAIKDDDLTDEADPVKTRKRIREMVERRYTAATQTP
jgi:hypothetical protein